MTKADLESIVLDKVSDAFVSLHCPAVGPAYMAEFEARVREQVAASFALPHWITFEWMHETQTLKIDTDLI